MQFRLGIVTHYYKQVGVAIVALENSIGVGDHIRFVFNNEDIGDQIVQSIQVEHEKVQSAKKGQYVGISVEQEVLPGAEVYKTQKI